MLLLCGGVNGSTMFGFSFVEGGGGRVLSRSAFGWQLWGVGSCPDVLRVAMHLPWYNICPLFSFMGMCGGKVEFSFLEEGDKGGAVSLSLLKVIRACGYLIPACPPSCELLLRSSFRLHCEEGCFPLPSSGFP